MIFKLTMSLMSFVIVTLFACISFVSGTGWNILQQIKVVNDYPLPVNIIIQGVGAGGCRTSLGGYERNSDDCECVWGTLMYVFCAYTEETYVITPPIETAEPTSSPTLSPTVLTPPPILIIPPPDIPQPQPEPEPPHTSPIEPTPTPTSSKHPKLPDEPQPPEESDNGEVYAWHPGQCPGAPTGQTMLCKDLSGLGNCYSHRYTCTVTAEGECTCKGEGLHLYDEH